MGITDIFIAKFNIDDEDNIYVCGTTSSTSGLATPGALNTIYGGGLYDGFLSKISSNGTLLFSTYFGGSAHDYIYDLAIDSSNNVWIAGGTRSINLPTTSDAFDSTYESTAFPDPYPIHGEGFYAKIAENGSTLMYSSYLGAESKELIGPITLDDSENVVLAGITTSQTFPTTANAWDDQHAGEGDIFLTKFTPNGSTMLYSTLIGGTDFEDPFSCAIDSDGNYVLSGITASNDFPVSANAYDKTFTGDSDGFILKLSADGSSLVFSTYLGGSGEDPYFSDQIDNIEFADGTSDIYFGGYTNSTDWPTTDGSTFKAERAQAVIGILSSDGSSLKYSTLIGGSTHARMYYGLDLINSEEAYLTGYTDSDDFPITADAFDSSLTGPVNPEDSAT